MVARDREVIATWMAALTAGPPSLWSDASPLVASTPSDAGEPATHLRRG
jgi:hypothetical protein